MSETEHQELNCWIAENVMGFTRGKMNRRDVFNVLVSPDAKAKGFVRFQYDEHLPTDLSAPHYTTDPAASDALDDALLERCGEMLIGFDEGEFYIETNHNGKLVSVSNKDKKICRALFAKEVFE